MDPRSGNEAWVIGSDRRRARLTVAFYAPGSRRGVYSEQVELGSVGPPARLETYVFDATFEGPAALDIAHDPPHRHPVAGRASRRPQDIGEIALLRANLADLEANLRLVRSALIDLKRSPAEFAEPLWTRGREATIKRVEAAILAAQAAAARRRLRADAVSMVQALQFHARTAAATLTAARVDYRELRPDRPTLTP